MDKLIDVIVAGAAGRMGRNIVSQVLQNPCLTLSGSFEHPDNSDIGKDAGILAGWGDSGIKIRSSLIKAGYGDVIVDFTSPEATRKIIELAASSKTAMVIGTTGLNQEDLAKLRKSAEKNFPCVQAPNMAIGVNILFKLVEKTASILGNDYDIEIVEAHHRMKKDAPSGTALKLGEMAAGALNRDFVKVGVFERNGIIGERSKTEIGIQTVRAGDITGEHTVYFAGLGERIELTHRAHNRNNFASGATLAAEWVIGKPNGLYTMFDVLGLNDF